MLIPTARPVTMFDPTVHVSTPPNALVAVIATVLAAPVVVTTKRSEFGLYAIPLPCAKRVVLY